MRVPLAWMLCCLIGWSVSARTVNVRDAGAKGDGVTDDSAAIQSVLDSKARPLDVWIPDGDYRIVKTLKVSSDTTIRAAAHARLFLCGETPHKRGDFLLDNADHEQGNANITIEGGIWDGNNQGRLNKKESDIFKPDAWSGTTMNFRNVRKLKLRDMTLANSVTYNIRMCQLYDFEIRDIRFFSERKAYNQDGLHFNGFVFNGVVENIRAVSKGQTNDDLLALNADDSMARLENFGMTCGPIENIVFRNIFAEDCHTAVRFLSVISPIRNIRIENLTAGIRCYSINADGARYCRTPLFRDEERPQGVGLLENIVIDGFTTWATKKDRNPLICLETNLRGYTLKNMTRDLAKDAAPDRDFLQIRKTVGVRLSGTDAQGNAQQCEIGERENRVFHEAFSNLILNGR